MKRNQTPGADGSATKLVAVLQQGSAPPEAKSAAWSGLKAMGAEAVPALLNVIAAHGDDGAEGTAGCRKLLESIGSAAIPVLVQALKSDNPALRKAAAGTVMEFGSAAAEAVPGLLRMLRADAEEAARAEAASALAAIGPPTSAVPLLIHGLASTSEAVGRALVSALVAVGPAALPALVEASGRADCSIRRRVVRALGEIGPPEAVLEPLTHALADDSTLVRREAAAVLWGLGPPAAAATPALVRALADPEEIVREQAAAALISIGEAAVPALIYALAGEFSELRDQAQEVLIPQGRQETIEALVAISMWSDFDDPNSRLSSVLRLLGPELARKLVECRSRRQAVIPILVQIDIGPARLVDVLVDCLDSSDPVVERAAVDALVRVGPQAVPALIRTLTVSPTMSVVDVLARIGQHAVPALVEALRDTDGAALSAAKALRRCGPASVPALASALGDSDVTVRQNAASVLRDLGPVATLAIPALSRATGDEDALVRRTAQTALLKIQAGVDHLSEDDQRVVGWFRSIDQKVWLTALQVFWCIGRLDQKALLGAGRAQGTRKLSARLAALKAGGFLADLPVSEGHLRENCIRALEGLFDKEPFYSEAWRPEESEVSFRSELPTGKRPGFRWTPRAGKAWRYIDRFLCIDHLLPRMEWREGDDRLKSNPEHANQETDQG